MKQHQLGFHQFIEFQGNCMEKSAVGTWLSVSSFLCLLQSEHPSKDPTDCRVKANFVTSRARPISSDASIAAPFLLQNSSVTSTWVITGCDIPEEVG